MTSTLADAHDRTWQRIGAPGTWFDGAQRVALAGEARRARDCALCLRRQEALSPLAVDGRHDTVSDLPADAVEVAHRVATDPGRLTKAWLDRLSITDAEYVEVVSVVTTVVGMDSFARAVGEPVRALPEPRPGEPARVRPDDLTDDGAWVPVRRVLGLPIIARALTLVPDESRAMFDLLAIEYLPPRVLLDMAEDPGRVLTRPQIELIAGRVSALNGCFY